MRTTFTRNFLAIAASVFVGTLPAIAAPAPQHAAHKADALRNALTARTATIDAKIAAARKAGRISTADATQMKKKLGRVRADSTRYAKRQGFLSAAESASYNRTLDEIETKLG